VPVCKYRDKPARIVKVLEKKSLVSVERVISLGVIHAMNKRLIALSLVAALLSFLPAAVASDRWETLRAINLVENPTNQTHMGSRGELGPYQFRAATWRMHTQKSFNMAIDRATADEVAASHYEWIKRGLDEAGVDTSTFNIAMAWNCGLSAVVAGRIPAASYRYAEQVTNLVQLFRQQEHAEALAATSVAAPSSTPSEFQVQFAAGDAQPRFVLVADAIVPRLIVATGKPRYVIAPVLPRFTLAVID
jgi:hypothetical protein